MQRPRVEGRKRVGIWVRVSREDPQYGDSPEHHEKRARFYAEERGWQVAEVYTSIVSGKAVWHLPEAKRMLADVERGHISGVLFSKLARLARNTREALDFAEYFEKHGADMIALDDPIDTSSPAGRFFFTNLAAMAQWEREEIAARTKASVSIRAKLGKPLSGSVSFGYRLKDRKLVPDPEEAPVRKLIYELYRKHQRKGAVARILNEGGYRTRRGKPFSPPAIERLILDPTAKGSYRGNHTTRSPDGKRMISKPESEWTVTAVEPIVSEELWDECVAILKHRRQPKRRPTKRVTHVFAGLLFCGTCNQKMYVPTESSKYTCATCRAKIPCADLEAIFQHKLREWSVDPAEVARYVENADDAQSEQMALLKQLEAEQKKVAQKMERTYQLYLDERVSSEAFGRLYSPLEKQHAQLEEEIPRLQAELDARRIYHQSADDLARAGARLHEIWPGLAREEKRAVAETLTERITLTGDAIEIVLCYVPPGNQEPTKSAQSPRTILLSGVSALRVTIAFAHEWRGVIFRAQFLG